MGGVGWWVIVMGSEFNALIFPGKLCSGAEKTSTSCGSSRIKVQSEISSVNLHRLSLERAQSMRFVT